MLKVGDIVVTMSYPGLFRVKRLDGDTVIIENDSAASVTVQTANIRPVKREPPPATD